jgi:hypothetical protein
MRRTLHALLILAVAAVVSGGARADDNPYAAAGLDEKRVAAFVTALQDAVRDDDKQAVAKLVRYPITAPIDGKRTRIAKPDAFVANYDRILTPKHREVILRAKPNTLFANAQGVMFGDGEIWISGICADKECRQSNIRIIAVNQKR